jgi:aminoglycoside 2'-N-acetyltransferase I
VPTVPRLPDPPVQKPKIRIAHTADLSKEELAAAEALIFHVFDDATADDWEHCLGGVHALAWDGAGLVGHAAVIQRRLIYRGAALRTGYVEGVAVRAGRRREGIGGALMSEMERIIKAAYDLGGLGASDEGLRFYAARGWQRWHGKTYALTPQGVVRTADDDDSVFVLPVSQPIDVGDDLTCDFRHGELW